MKRLTYKNNLGEAYLEYGADAIWKKCEAYDVLKNAISKLAEYEDLEEQGLLPKLPCKVGDMVYNHVPIRKGKDTYSETKVKSIEIREDNIYIWFENGLGKTLSNFMRSSWLTKEEAEKALAEMEK